MRVAKKHFALLLLPLLLLSCASEKPISQHTTNVVRQLQIQEYGPHIYFAHGKVWRYNRNTNELSKACLDPECKGDCILEGAVTYINQVLDGKLFFSSFTAFTHNYAYGYQDLLSGDVTVLKELSATETSGNSVMAVWDGAVYYCRKILRDGGSKINPDDYETWICCVSADGTNEKPMMKLSGDSLMAICDGKFILLKEGKLVAADISTFEETELLDFDSNGFTLPGSKISSINDKIYLLMKSRDSFVSEYKQVSYAKNYLISIDLSSLKWEKVVDCPVITFCLTDDAIYYSPMVQRHLYVPENYSESPEKVVVFYADESLHRCSLDGTNDKIVYTNDMMDFSEEYTVINGILFGWLFDYDEKAHSFVSGGYFGSIDFSSGTVKRAIGDMNNN